PYTTLFRSERAAEHPTQRDGGSQAHSGFKFATTRLLEETHAPGHAEDGCGNEQEPGDQTAQDGLGVEKHRLERSENAGQAAGGTRRTRLLGQKQHQAGADHQPDDTRINPEPAPRNSALDDWPDEKLPGRPTGHAEHLRRADERRGQGSGKVFRDEIDSANEREHAASALQESADVRGGDVSGAEQQRTDPYQRRADRDDAPRAETV